MVGEYCYMKGPGELTYDMAKEDCEFQNAYLIEPRTPELNEIAINVADNSEIWIGATDIDMEGFWWWEASNVSFTGNWANWRKGQPNDHGKGQDCATVTYDGWWGDIGCGQEKPYVCMTEPRKSTICSNKQYLY